MKKFLAITTILFVYSLGFGQVNIHMKTLFPRPGDKLKIFSIQASDTIGDGINQTWDFSEAKLSNQRQTLTIVALNETEDSLGCILGNSQHRYHTNGDTLFYDGFENNRSDIILTHKELSLSKDIIAGVAQTSTFNGSGRYTNRWHQNQSGVSSTIMDARGTIITPDLDTIFDAFRVRTRRDILHCHGASSDINAPMTDTLRMTQTISRIYALGYRYPIIYTSELQSPITGTTIARSAYYLPLSSIESIPDPENEAIRNFIAVQHDQNSYGLRPTLQNDCTSIISYSIFQDRASRHVTIEYSVSESTQVEIVIANIAGIVYSSKTSDVIPGETYTASFDYGSLPYAAAYGINISVGNEQHSEKFYR